MAQRKTLTDKQVQLLRWIGGGCPQGIMEGDSYRISAAALRNRGLVRTSGRGPTWGAKITSAGRASLTAVDGPNPPIAREANASVTEQLVRDVIAAGGVLRVPRRGWYSRDGVDYGNRVRLATRHGKVPDGKRLTVAAVELELEIRLVDAPGRSYKRAELVQVSVPERVARYHSAARQFRKCSERHEVSREQLQRATRIIDAIAKEAERRGWSVQGSSESTNGYGRDSWTGAKDGHLLVVAGEHGFCLRLQEKGVRTRGPWEEEVRRYRNVSRDWSFYRDRELPSGPHDAGATGQLVIELNPRGGSYGGRQSRFSDRQSWTLEERLPQLFREIEDRILEAEHEAEDRRVAAERAAETAQREAEERRRTWLRLMDRAAERLLEDQHAGELRRQAEAWHEAERIRRYCDAAEAAHGDLAETARWLAWARNFAQRLDPLAGPPGAPEILEVTLDELQPYFPTGWSALGPEQGRRRSPYDG
jgi:hypothetical protein